MYAFGTGVDILHRLCYTTIMEYLTRTVVLTDRKCIHCGERYVEKYKRVCSVCTAANQAKCVSEWRKNNPYKTSISTAKRRKLEWDISEEEYSIITSRRCHYCDGDLGRSGCRLDRKDNSVGYLKENVIPCCYSCNMIRNDLLTVEEMEVAMKAVLELRRLND